MTTQTKPVASRLGELIHKFRTDELFRRVCIGSPAFTEMLSAALMEDRTGVAHTLASHNAPSIDVIAPDGNHIQVKSVGTKGSIVRIHKGRDIAVAVMIVTVFAGETPRFFLVPMGDFKELSLPYDRRGRTVPRGQAEQWEIRAGKIAKGYLAKFEIAAEQAVPILAA
jgi:hypothetical protein